MKVCTLTWFRGGNFGSILQAYALRKAVEEMGYGCDVLAYRQSKITALKKRFLYHNYLASVAYKANIQQISQVEGGEDFIRSRNQACDEFRNREMRFSAPCTTRRELLAMNRKYDAFICGSDQIWNPYLFDGVFYLDFVQGNYRKIAYAPSFGVNNFPSFCQRQIVKRLKQIPQLSVRESTGTDIILSLTGQHAPAVVDPCLLINSEKWENLSQPINTTQSEPYILCYFLSQNAMYDSIVAALSSQTGRATRWIPVLANDLARKEVILEAVGPAEWLALIKNAEYVVTDSFHCTLFSLLFHKNYYVVRRFAENDPRGQNSRIYHLLKVTSMQDRLLTTTHINHFQPIKAESFVAANRVLDTETAFSRNFLKNALDNVKKGSKSGND